jgi:hypothetical protein
MRARDSRERRRLLSWLRYALIVDWRVARVRRLAPGEPDLFDFMQAELGLVKWTRRPPAHGQHVDELARARARRAAKRARGTEAPVP